MTHLVQPSAILGAETVRIGDFLSSKQFKIPVYQRDYSWGDEELAKLWEDVCRVRKLTFPGGKLVSNPEPHFLGAIVTQDGKGDNPPEVIDGQQRLATLSILISVLYEFASNLSDQDRSEELKFQLMSLIAYSYPEGRRARLSLAREDDFFNETVIKRSTLSSKRKYWATVAVDKNPVANRISNAVNYFYDQMRREINEPAESDRAVVEIVLVVTELLIVLNLNVADHRLAYRVFETLNFRGLDLSQADLIKNELVRTSKPRSDVEKVALSWAVVVRNLEKVTSVSLVEFLQFHYASKYGPVKMGDLFEAVVRLLDEQVVDSRSYAADLAIESTRLVQVIEGDAESWSDASNQALEELREVLNLKYAYPLLMAAAARFASDPEGFENWALRVRDFCFRYVTIERNPQSRFAATVTSAARKLRDTDKDDSEVLSYLQLASSDRVFENEFAKATVPTNKLGFYIIKRIEDHISSGSGITLPQSAAQHLEHIMPKKLGKSWDHILGDPLYDSYIMRIGNLLGLEQKINSHIKNKEFSYKYSNGKELDYCHSKFELPRQVTRFLNDGKWTFESVTDRQEFLAANYAVAVWPLV
ncbi:MAG: DUF262 domain-containing protein [Dietzia maris]